MYYIDKSIELLNGLSNLHAIPIQKILVFENNNSMFPRKDNYYIEGQSYEKNESQKYQQVKYIVERSIDKEILAEYISADGSFYIENLPNEFINLIVIDESKTYNGKYIVNLNTQLDYKKSMDIIRIYENENSALIRIKFNGDESAVSVFADNASVSKVDNLYYRIDNIVGEYKITLHDYVNNVLYVKEKTYSRSQN